MERLTIDYCISRGGRREPESMGQTEDRRQEYAEKLGGGTAQLSKRLLMLARFLLMTDKKGEYACDN